MSRVYGGKLTFTANKNKSIDEYSEHGYSFGKPEVWMEGAGEDYYPQTLFSWDRQSIVLKRGNNVLKLNDDGFWNCHAVDSDNNELVINGSRGPHEGSDLDENHKEIHYLDEFEPGRELTVEEYDLNTLKKRQYKVVLESEVDMDDYDIINYCEVDMDEYMIKYYAKEEMLEKETIRYTDNTEVRTIQLKKITKNTIDVSDHDAVKKYIDDVIKKEYADENIVVNFVDIEYYPNFVYFEINFYYKYCIFPEEELSDAGWCHGQPYCEDDCDEGYLECFDDDCMNPQSLLK